MTKKKIKNNKKEKKVDEKKKIEKSCRSKAKHLETILLYFLCHLLIFRSKEQKGQQISIDFMW